MTFEYMTREVTELSSQAPDTDALDSYGAEGWELVAAWPTRPGSWSPGVMCVFKRRLPDPLPDPYTPR